MTAEREGLANPRTIRADQRRIDLLLTFQRELGPINCWPWPDAPRGTGGYGTFRRLGVNVRAHRWAYELLVGPLPEGLVIDHLCRNRGCVNPAHLEPVPIRENTLRGIGPTAFNARKTHCPKGHAFNDENTYMKNGTRQCRACRNAAAKAYRRRIKEAS